MVGGGSANDTDVPPERGGELLPVDALRLAVDRYEDARSPQARAVAELRGERASVSAEVDEIRTLFKRLPEFEQLVNLAVGETERSVQAAGARLWDWFGLTTPPPRWDAGERRRAPLPAGCACAPLGHRGC